MDNHLEYILGKCIIGEIREIVTPAKIPRMKPLKTNEEEYLNIIRYFKGTNFGWQEINERDAEILKDIE